MPNKICKRIKPKVFVMKHPMAVEDIPAPHPEKFTKPIMLYQSTNVVQ